MAAAAVAAGKKATPQAPVGTFGCGDPDNPFGLRARTAKDGTANRRESRLGLCHDRRPRVIRPMLLPAIMILQQQQTVKHGHSSSCVVSKVFNVDSDPLIP